MTRLRCALFGHRYRPMLTRSFWAPLVHACTRCGTPAPAPAHSPETP